MTAVDTAPRAPRTAFVAPGRLVRLEARRNAMLLLLPLVAAMFWFDTYQTAMATPNVWGIRGYIFQRHLLFDFAPFIAGAAAWAGSRDSRRDMIDMVTVTSRPRWVTLLASLSATIGWALLGYAVCVAALYGAIAGRHPFGSAPWWPVAVGAASVIMLCALGFVAGVFFPGRFAAPVVAITALILVEAGSRSVAISNRSPYALLSPTNADSHTVTLFPDLGLFYPNWPDLSIVQVMFLIGVTVVLLGVLGLPAKAGGPRLRGLAALAAVAGLALTGTAVHLVGTAQATATGMMSVPALHHSSEDQPVAYVPVCTGTAIPVCVHPAFKSYLTDADAALRPILTDLAGLPGAPTKVMENTSDYRDLNFTGEQLIGTPPVLYVPIASYVPITGTSTDQNYIRMLRKWSAPVLVADVIGNGSAQPGDQAQQAVELGLLKAGGVVTGAACKNACAPGPQSAAPGSAIDAPATRFAALSATERHAWLVANLPALRAGQITLEQIP